MASEVQLPPNSERFLFSNWYPTNIPIFFSIIDLYRFSYSYPSCKDLKNFNSAFEISYFLKLGWSLIQLKIVTLSVKLLILRSWLNQCYWFVVIGWLMIWILILFSRNVYISPTKYIYFSSCHWNIPNKRFLSVQLQLIGFAKTMLVFVKQNCTLATSYIGIRLNIV